MTEEKNLYEMMIFLLNRIIELQEYAYDLEIELAQIRHGLDMDDKNVKVSESKKV